MRLHGNESVWSGLRTFLESPRGGLALVVAPTGYGKTTGIRILAHEMKRQTIDIYGSEVAISAREIESTATRQSFGGRALVVLEDVDAWSDKNIQELKLLSKRCSAFGVPIACTASNLYAASLRGVRGNMRAFTLRRLPFGAMRSVVQWHVPKASSVAMRANFEAARGDLRQTLIRTGGIDSHVDRRRDIFEWARGVLASKSEVRVVLEAFRAHSEISLVSILFENYLDNVPGMDMDAIADRAAIFSSMDVLKQRDRFMMPEAAQCTLLGVGSASRRSDGQMRFKMIPRDPVVSDAASRDVPKVLSK